MGKSDERLIVALDFHDMAAVRNMVDALADTVVYYKVGMELFYSVGQQVIDFLQSRHKKIFLDLKLHDIPTTVARSISTLTGMGINMFNVHAAGGWQMMRQAGEAAAAEAARQGIARPCLLAVTVLTSINAAEWQLLACRQDIAGQVLTLATAAAKAGLDGVVASPREAAGIRKACGDAFTIVTPGIRPVWAAANDQSRIASPREAIGNGANYLVVGRPVTTAQDPQQAAMRITEEMNQQ